MNIKKLAFTQFRNYESASFSFDPGSIHVFCGPNAQGKTNILEGIYFLSHLRSFRTLKLPSLIRHGQDFFAIDAFVERKGKMEDLKVLVHDGKKKLSHFGSPVSSTSSFVGLVNAILFCPDDLSLFSDSPKRRRQFMDMELVKLSQTYTAKLSHYQKILKDRNNLLKSFKPDGLLLETLTAQMIEDQAILIAQRHSFLKDLEAKVQKILPGFSKEEETITIRYKTCVNPDADIRSQLEQAYAKGKSRDLMMKNTGIGIHKDDVEFYLNGTLLTQNASQGQKRSVLLALKLAVASIIREKTGQYPILLLDDVFSELDPWRRGQLVASLPAEMQIFITTTEQVNPAWFDRPARFYTVKNGKVKEGLYDISG